MHRMRIRRVVEDLPRLGRAEQWRLGRRHMERHRAGLDRIARDVDRVLGRTKQWQDASELIRRLIETDLARMGGTRLADWLEIRIEHNVGREVGSVVEQFGMEWREAWIQREFHHLADGVHTRNCIRNACRGCAEAFEWLVGRAGILQDHVALGIREINDEIDAISGR